VSCIGGFFGISFAFSLDFDGAIVAVMVGSGEVGFNNSGLLCEYSVLSLLGCNIIAFKEGSGFLLAEVEEVEDGLPF
jgi:hypothetical protein